MVEISGSWIKCQCNWGLLAILQRVIQADWIRLILCS
jgi:hypothetical protein